MDRSRTLGVLLVAGLPIACGGGFQQTNRPIEAAIGSAERTGFGRSTTTTVQETGAASQAYSSTRTTQAASVVEGPRGDRLWRISSNGSFLEFCRLLDEQPFDCTSAPLPIATLGPTLVEPRNLGEGTFFDQGGPQVRFGQTVRAGSLPTTPRFGVWVLANPTTDFVTLTGVGRLGSGLLFCHLGDAGKPRCVDTKTTVSRALSVHVLGAAPAPAPAPKLVHVLWGQPDDEGVAIRCEADETTGITRCQKATEITQP